MTKEPKFALLIIDMQNAWVGPGKKVFPSRRNAVTTINELRNMWAWRNWPVFHITLTHSSDGATLSPFDSKLWNVEGTKKAQILPQLTPYAHEIVIRKHRYSAFHKTELLEALQKHQITDCVIVGYQARACIMATAMDSYQHDFKTHLIPEAILETDQENSDLYNKIFKEAGLLVSYSEFLLKTLPPSPACLAIQAMLDKLDE